MYKKPYFWVMPGVPNKWVCIYRDFEHETQSLLFWQGCLLPTTDIGGIRLSQDPATYDLVLEAVCRPDQLLKCGALATTIPAPIVREDVLAILQEECPDDFQAFPVTIKAENDQVPPFELTNYFLINVTNLAGQLDEELCEGSINYERHNSNIKYKILKEDHMDGHHLSRLRGDKHSVIVSPYLRQRLMKSKIWGLKFEKDDTERRIKTLALKKEFNKP